jgi:hypothetical protein
MYLNGSQPGSYASPVNGVAPVTSETSDGICLGNRASDSARGLNGRLADAAIWSAVLSADEIASLAKGFAPRRVRPQALVHDSRLIREVLDQRAGAAVSAASGTVVAHPRVY